MTAPRAPRRRRRWAAGGAAAAAAAAAGIGAGLAGDGSEDARAEDDGPSATVEIERKDLVELEEQDGTLGYADARPVISRLEGTITWLPAAGRTVRTNHRLLEVDGEAVYLLDGAVPAHRALEPGTSGRDVLQLERNLRRLELDPEDDMDVDGTWDAGTTRAVERWQERKGLEETGRIELGRVVFQPGTRRVADVAAVLGASTGSAAGAASADGGQGGSSSALTTTSARRIVVVRLPTSRTELAARGDRVRIELPDGKVVGGRIAATGRVASLPEGEDADASDATIRVTVKLTGGGAQPALDQAPVTVRFEQRRKRDVLAIPVTALQAQAGGEFAVEVREGASRRLVRVEPGLYTSGDVEISGDGLREGMRVTDAEV